MSGADRFAVTCDTGAGDRRVPELHARVRACQESHRALLHAVAAGVCHGADRGGASGLHRDRGNQRMTGARGDRNGQGRRRRRGPRRGLAHERDRVAAVVVAAEAGAEVRSPGSRSADVEGPPLRVGRRDGDLGAVDGHLQEVEHLADRGRPQRAAGAAAGRVRPAERVRHRRAALRRRLEPSAASARYVGHQAAVGLRVARVVVRVAAEADRHAVAGEQALEAVRTRAATGRTLPTRSTSTSGSGRRRTSAATGVACRSFASHWYSGLVGRPVGVVVVLVLVRRADVRRAPGGLEHVEARDAASNAYHALG